MISEAYRFTVPIVNGMLAALAFATETTGAGIISGADDGCFLHQ